MKICFIGDSHLGHIKPAWDLLASRYQSLSVDFRIERTYGTMPLQLVGNAPGDANVVFDDIRVTYAPVVDCSAADVFVVFGMHFSMNTLARTYPRFRSDALTVSGESYLLSNDCYQASANDLLMSHKAGRVITSLKNLTDKPVVYVQQPHPLEWIRDRRDLNFDFYKSIVESNDAAEFARVFSNSLQHLEGLGVLVSRQAPETTIGNIFTLSEFGLADPMDTTDDSLYTRGDYYHMNAQYGLRVLAQLIDHDLDEVLRVERK